MQISRRKFLQVSATAALSPLYTSGFSTDSDTAALCKKLASDPLRSQYHLLPAHNWMNDPNGPIFYKGRYHMFHQYNPKAAVWGNMNWAHATSPDLIHWEHEPIAMSPTPGGYDRDGVFSGSAVLDNGKPTVIYTGVLPPSAGDGDATLRDGVHAWREVQCLAVAEDDGLRTWRKLPEPVIASPPPGLRVSGFRDPCLWRENDKWMLIVGSGFYGKGGAILLYSSSDLRHWTYLHPLVEGQGNGTKNVNPVDTGEMWECPDFFPLGKKHVLLISTMGKVRWKVGIYSNQRFTPEKEGVVDWGSYYAAKTMLDKHGNRVLWGWIPETRPDSDMIAAGWAGAMSLPRVMSLSAQDELLTEPHPAARMLRGEHYEVDANKGSAERNRALETIRIDDLAAEIALRVEANSSDFILKMKTDAGEFTTLSGTVVNGRRQLQIGNVTAPIPGDSANPISLHILLDGSILEIFANDGIALTARVYQKSSGPLRLKLDGGAELASLDVWQMKPISKDRLTGPLCA